MKILVLLKQTPDTESKIQLSGDSTKIETSGLKYVMNPYDEFAVEEALKIKTQTPGSEVIIASFGPDAVKERILKALAMGADRGVQVSQEGLESLDSLGVAKVLKALVDKEKPGLVLCGRQGIDEDNMHVGVMVAEKLGWPHVNVVTKVDMGDGKAQVEREVEGGKVETYEVTLPAVLGAHKSLNNPRYASLPGIMKAKKKPFDRLTVSDLSLDGGALTGEVKTQTVSFAFPPPKPSGKMYQGQSAEEMVGQLVKALREEAKII